jgi:signal transduction histidine kinase
VVVSLYTRPNALEAAQAERFIGVFAGERRRVTATSDALEAERLEALLAKFTGLDMAREAFTQFYASRGIAAPAGLPAAQRRDLADFVERTLSGAVGAASAQAIMQSIGRGMEPEAIFDVVGRVSRSLEQSREDLQRRVRELSLLYEASRHIASTLDPERMAEVVVRLMHREFGFDVVIVRILDSDGRLRIKGAVGFPPGANLSGAETISMQSYFGECFLENRLVVVENAAEIRKPVVLPADAPEPRSFVHAPIAVDSAVLGVLSAYSSTGRVYFSTEFLQFVRTLALQLGLGIQHVQLYRELGDLSRELEAKVRQRTTELEDANRRLKELDRLKSEVVSTVSHELRTPLTSIRSLSEILIQGDVPDDRRQQFLTIIAEESQRLSRLISQLLDLSRIEAGKMEWRMEPLDLAEVASQAARANHAVFDESGVALEVNAPAGRVTVRADRDKMMQVLTNLLSNAAKFTPRGGFVMLRVFAEDGQGVVEVEDSGPGIPAADQEAIFERFHQAGDTTRAKPFGVGLGLPISREIVEHHGGSLTVQSQPGAGSCFRVTLPCDRRGEA